jgi:hypothetical protein
MSLTTADVLDTLNDSVTLGMYFWVGPIFVSGIGYRLVRDNIYGGSIMVLEGAANQTLAFYNSSTDVLTTQTGTSPASLEQRALLLHECTHALIDVFNTSGVTRHIDELAAYIAQLVYTMRSNPSWTMAANNSPWPNFFQGVFNLIKARGLDTIAGNSTMISVNDLEPLRQQLAALPGVNYGTFARGASSGSNGMDDYGTFMRLARRMASGVG